MRFWDGVSKWQKRPEGDNQDLTMNDCLLALSRLSALKILSLNEIAFECFLRATPAFLFVFNRPLRPVHTINGALSAYK
jgi:hypothetical protein